MKNKLTTVLVALVFISGLTLFNGISESWGATVRVSQSNYDANEPVEVSFEGLPGNPDDFIGIYVSGAPDLFYLETQYTNGLESGTITFPGPFVSGGEYEARAYSGSLSNRLCNTFFTIGDNEIEKVITNHHRQLAGLASRVYPGYFDALSAISTIFTIPDIDFEDYSSDYTTVRYWGGNPDEVFGEEPFSYSGCDAALYYNIYTGKYVLSFRGTTAQFQDLIEDFRLLLSPPSGLFGDYHQFIDADAIVQELIDIYGNDILNNLEFTGHSLGGALAQAMGLKYGLPATSFNAVGLPDEALSAIGVAKDSNFWSNADNLIHINVSGDPMTDWNWNQGAYSFWDTLPRYGRNYWLPAKYSLSISRLRNHYYNVLINQMERYSTMELRESIY